MKLDVIRVFVFEYLEKISHCCSAECGEGLPANGNYEAGVLIAEFYEGGEDAVRLAGARAALVYLYPLL